MKILMKVISMAVLLTFATSAMAAESGKLKFSLDVAQKLDGDINFYRKTIDDCNKNLDNVKKQGATQDAELDTLKKEVAALKLDLSKEVIATAGYKDLYVKVDNERLTAEAGKPSRMTWFGVGSVSTAILGAIVIVFIKK